MPNTLNKVRYRVEDLVTIGDAIHDSYASFIVAANISAKETAGEGSITTAIHGHPHELVNMLTKVLEENDLVREILLEAISKMALKVAENIK
jgi:hypothetical protein